MKRSHQSLALILPALAAVLIASGCPDDKTKVKKPVVTRALAVASDFFSGSDLVSFDIPAGLSFSATDISVSTTVVKTLTSTDTQSYYRNDKLYVIDRGSFPANAGVLRVYDAENDYALLSETVVGTNPQYLTFISDTEVWITRYAEPSILVLNPQTNLAITEVPINESMVTLSDTLLADSDGLPEACGICFAAGKVYVAIQRIDNVSTYTPVGESFVIVFDPATRAMIGQISLPYANPTIGPRIEPATSEILVGCVGTYAAFNDGGIVKLDTSSDSVHSIILSETDAGGTIYGFAYYDDETAYVLSNAGWVDPYILKAFNPMTGSVDATAVYQTTGFGAPFSIIDGKLIFGDLEFGSEGLIFFNAETGERITDGAIATGSYGPVQILEIE